MATIAIQSQKFQGIQSMSHSYSFGVTRKEYSLKEKSQRSASFVSGHSFPLLSLNSFSRTEGIELVRKSDHHFDQKVFVGYLDFRTTEISGKLRINGSIKIYLNKTFLEYGN